MTSAAASFVSNFLSNTWSLMNSFNIPGFSFTPAQALIAVCFVLMVFKVSKVIFNVFSSEVGRGYRAGNRAQNARIAKERRDDTK